ncbi:hypothetical protein DMN91_004698 [Ooceraea biroi]|uniref:Uncharacterized protein n=1 Tax=Ooceraea biroi TaxID=2015173 RepID=A0A3L8DPR2_OOCBI|nr:hypothetical protein DMN91_004698 [Ooceraea biroi]
MILAENSASSFITQLEPVATKKPKFSSDAKKAWYDRVRGDDLTLFCPAQGFPVPTYRASRKQSASDDGHFERRLHGEKGCFQRCTILPCAGLSEPVGSKAPAFTGDVKGVWMEKMMASSVVLPCPAQGYPVPSFRVYGWSLLRNPTSYCSVQRRAILYPPLEPIGTKAPALSELRAGWLKKRMNSNAVLSCPAQGYPVPSFRDILYLPLGKVTEQLTSARCVSLLSDFAVTFVPPEPVGGKAPALTGDLKGGWKQRDAGFTVVLFCPAQGHPVPSFRTGRHESTLDSGGEGQPDGKAHRHAHRDPLPRASLPCANIQPVGSKAPSVTGDAKRWLETKSTAGFALQCQAQSHPVPAFR